MWLRFQTNCRHQVTRWGVGLLHFVPEVLENPDVPEGVKAEIEVTCSWISTWLPVPRISNPSAIFWFKTKPDLAVPVPVKPWKRRPLTKLASRVPKLKIPSTRPVDLPDAAATIERMQKLTNLIRFSCASRVHIITTRTPGYIVYEDPYQIAAIPFRDTKAEHALDPIIP